MTLEGHCKFWRQAKINFGGILDFLSFLSSFTLIQLRGPRAPGIDVECKDRLFAAF